MASQVTKEADFQKFFETHPSLLCEGVGCRVYSQLVLERDDATSLRPDFFLEPLGTADAFPTIVDLKLASEPLILAQKNRSRFYAKLHEFAAQLREYGDYFDSPTNRKRVEERYGIRTLRPRLVMIVGKDYSQRDYQLIDRIKRSVHPVEVRTYDEILSFGRSILEKQRPT